MNPDRCPTCASGLTIRPSTRWTGRIRCGECHHVAHYSLDGWAPGWGVAPYAVGLLFLLIVLAAAYVDAL